uniref:preprotein translocase subunit SecE n=1 Tax=Lachnoclostridium phocaeense TaxID=1871021 RepID=UPI0026DAE447|nr:preprotein translocase subunit SecE [Lachnoclostridium phocaeense]
MRRLKRISSEWRSISKPSFKKTAKDTGFVIVVAALFSIILYGIDTGMADLVHMVL